MGKLKLFKNQNFDSLRSEAKGSGKLFIDPEFPPEAKSIYQSKDVPSDVVWKRPGEICKDPQLFVEGASAEDFHQGDLGNCWFVAACSAIAKENKLWKKVVPDYEDQDFKSSNYSGIFHFHFFMFGEWTDVVIDDMLPTRDGKLTFIHSSDPNEFWSALIEKAYAKIFGDYESLEAGKARDALVDMMGGVGQGVELQEYASDAEKRNELFQALLEGEENHSLMSGSISAKAEEMEAKLENGLIKGHAYSVTDVKTVKIGSGLVDFFKNETIDMIRLRNPWGEKEWNGAWSDGSAEWKKISEDEKKDMGLIFRDNGEFWMSFADFCRHFTNMDICHVFNTSVFSFSRTWKEEVVRAAWKRPHAAGGCPNHDSHLLNPQYLFDVKDKEAEVIISLEQDDMRVYREDGKVNTTIGCAVFKADLNRKYRLNQTRPVAHTSPFVNSRGIFTRVKLVRGRYCLIPSSFDPGHEGKFLLRVYSDSDIDFREAEMADEGLKGGGCCGGKPAQATTITIHKAAGIEKQDVVGGADPYFTIECEGEKVRSHTVNDTLNPEWEASATFYRKNPHSDIRIEVYNEEVLKDEFMGLCLIMGATQNTKVDCRQMLRMTGEGSDAMRFKPGQLDVELRHYSDATHA